MSSMHERVEIRVIEGVACVTPTGELDLVTAPSLRAALEDAVALEPTLIVVTLREVTFLDSTGLGAIVAGWRAASDRGIQLRLLHPSPAVRRILDVTGLDELLDDAV
jgi:anti-anti-sigma factor